MWWWLALARKKMWWWIASFGESYNGDVLQYAKQLLSLRLPQMTKYCVMRECDNIHRWICTTGDLAFSHQQEFTVLNSQKGFWRSLPEISLFSLSSLCEDAWLLLARIQHPHSLSDPTLTSPWKSSASQFFAWLHKQIIWLRFKIFVGHHSKWWKEKDWMQCRLFWSSCCYWQAFIQEVMHMHSQVWAQLLEIKFVSIIWFDFSNQWAIQRMNQVVNQFANQSTIERRVSQSYLTLRSKETSLLLHFSWLLHSSQTTMPYPSMTSLLPNFSWLLHPSQMNSQKAYQRRQLKVQWTTRGRADRSLTMCQLTRGNAQWRLTRWTSNELEKLLPLNLVGFATIKHYIRVRQSKLTQLWARQLNLAQLRARQSNLVQPRVRQSNLTQNQSSQVKRQTVVNN